MNLQVSTYSFITHKNAFNHKMYEVHLSQHSLKILRPCHMPRSTRPTQNEPSGILGGFLSHKALNIFSYPSCPLFIYYGFGFCDFRGLLCFTMCVPPSLHVLFVLFLGFLLFCSFLCFVS